jgi:diaminopimelate decarboxylase/aspartate kinase
MARKCRGRAKCVCTVKRYLGNVSGNALRPPQQGILIVSENWIVLKFGGTSVAGRKQWDTIASIVQARLSEGFRVLLVCSAVAGVTNQLNALAYQPGSAQRRQELLDVHLKLGRELGVGEGQWLEGAKQQLDRCLQDLEHDPGPRHRAALLALGEWISTRMGWCFLQQTVETVWVDAREALETVSENEMSPARQWLSATCHAAESAGLASRWAALGTVLITQGFIARNRNGDTALLGRGGSDTSAALLAGRLSASRLEIWTDVPGLFSADPRLIDEARLLSEVDYAEALEMAASGARVVHPRSIRAAAATHTPVLIRDLDRRDVAGTRIGSRVAGRSGVKTVTCQKHMAVILLQNLDARFQVGFLAEVFDTIRKRGVSVDLVATSETTTTIAINCGSNHLGSDELKDLAEDLSTLCKVTLFRDCVCINLVGRGARTALGRLQPVMDFFEDRPLLMVSQSANDLCLSLLVEEEDHELLLRSAHSVLIPAEPGDADGIFGPAWERLRSPAGLGTAQ